MPHSTTSPTPRRPHRTMRPFTAAAGVPVPPGEGGAELPGRMRSGHRRGVGIAGRGGHLAELRFRGPVPHAYLGRLLHDRGHFGGVARGEPGARRARGRGPGRALPAAALSVRLLRENHPRHAAHRASVLLLLHHRYGLGHRQPGAGGHSHPVAVLGCLHRRNRPAAACCRWTRGRWKRPEPSASPAPKPCAT